MSWIEALVLGLLQGLTEFLPVSSSGHLEIGQVILKTGLEDNLAFAITVHGATVLSTIVVFFSEIKKLSLDALQFKWNKSSRFIAKIFVSMIPVLIVGVFFNDFVENLYRGNLQFVGFMLLVTALLLGLTGFIKVNEKDVSYLRAFIIGIMQAVAVIPGISRSGATISTALMLGVKKDLATRFSFLMVLIPIIGANLLAILKHTGESNSSISSVALMIGFMAAFISGLVACKLMINIVKNGKLIYFALYCAIVGIIAIVI
jgi:undecaprenyl-diphosphatase